mmetsp:Transcript_13115/g.43369  ORF Transcript_13115/g.43369 Transcript_13115/m.43369 type:complete len:254 (-) Transcript_13115:3-764(-)
MARSAAALSPSKSISCSTCGCHGGGKSEQSVVVGPPPVLLREGTCGQRNSCGPDARRNAPLRDRQMVDGLPHTPARGTSARRDQRPKPCTPPPSPPSWPLPLPPPPREGATCTRTFTASDMSMCSFVEPGQLPTAPAPAATSAAAPSPSWSSGSVSSMQPYAAYIFGPRSGGSDQWGSAEARLSWPVREVYAANGIAAAQSACCLGSSSAKSAAGGKSLSFSSRAAEPSSIPPERCSFRRAAERRAGAYPSKK